MPWRTCRGRKLWREPAPTPFEFADEWFTTGPGAIPDLWLWLRTDSLSALSDLAVISSWPDSSDWGHDAVQGTGGLEPIYRTNVRNGRAIARFDGVNDRLAFTSTGTTGDWTVFVAGQATNVVTNSLNYIVCQTGSGCFVGGSHATFGVGWGQFQEQGTAERYRIANTEPLDWGVWTWTKEKLYRNAVETSYGLVGVDGMTALGFDTVGARPDIDNLGFIGDLGEVLLFTRQLEDLEREEVHEYLFKRWAIVA